MRERNHQVITYLHTIHVHLPIWTILIPFFLLIGTSSTFAQPANDPCNGAVMVPTDGTCIDGNNTLATPDVGNGSCVANGPGAANIWFSFTAAGTDYDISAPGLAGSAEITLVQFAGAPCDFAAAVEIDCGVGNIVGNNVLTVGLTYYVIISSSNGTEGNVSICVDNPVDPPPPPNDDPCAPTPIPADGTCTTGTTVNATQDWSNPNCPNLGENSVWYSVTLTGTNNALDVVIGNQTVGGDVSVMVGTFTPDCTGGFGFVDQYCGTPMTTLNVTGLMPGSTYWIVVSSEDANAGMFDICATEMGPPAACAANDLCSGAGDVSGAPIQQVCLQGCTNGVGPDNTGGAGCFDFSTVPTVWYTFTTDATTAFVTLSTSSPDFDQPQMAVFEGNCAGYTPLDCNTGAGGSVILTNVAVTPNTTYVVAVGSVGGQEGDFTFCAFYQGSGGTNCITSGEVQVTNTSLGSPPSGPFQPGEVVSYCLNINWTSTGNNCQWLHGVVPSFGECWDPISFDADGLPVNVTSPLPFANAYPDGDVTYNDIPSGALPAGAPVGAGWFVVGQNNNGNLPGQCGPNDFLTDPNCSFGIPMNCDATATYTVCFDLMAKSFADCENNPAAIDCGVSFKTYGDGETGGWGSAGCEADIPVFGNFSLNCCIGPELLFTPITTCSGVQLDIFLDDYLLPPSNSGDVSYTWTVSAPAGVTGASDCPGSCGTILSQILVNTTGGLQSVTYTITPRSLDGCLGLPVELTVNVLPEVVANIDNPTGAICSGGCTNLFASATGGAPGYTYEWFDGSSGTIKEVCPTFTTMYTMVATDQNGCTDEAEITVEANPNLDVDIFVVPDINNTPDFIEMCDQDPNFPVTLSAFADLGGPNWFYSWECPGGAAPTNPFVQATQSGFHYVTLTDANGCTGESEIEIIIHPSPTIILFPAGPFCEGDPPQTLTVVTLPGGGTGNWIGNFDGNDDFVPDTPGPNTVYYEFEDDNGCTNIDSMVIQVNPIPDPPTFVTAPTSVCQLETNITFCVDFSANETYCVWQVPQGAVIVSGDSMACIVVDWNDAPAGPVCVIAGNDCGESAPTCVNVDVDFPPSTPTGLAGPQMPCENETGLVYTIDAVAGATGYTWDVTGGTITTNGTTSITVTWGTGPGTVCVTADNDCGSSPQACINVDPIVAPDPPVLVDPGPVCAGDANVVYTIAAVTGATTYNWSVPAGATFTGQGTTSITVDWGTSTGGQICVNAENVCGTSTDACINITPDTPPTLTGPITGLSIVCANDAGETYSIPAATGANGYNWVITGGTQATGGTTNQITVDWGAGPSGQVCVTAFNDCGSSTPPVCMSITINSIPSDPIAPIDGTICEGANGEIYTIAAVNGATTYNWTVPAPATFTGQGTTSITVDWNGTVSTAQICVNAENDCGISGDACFDVVPTLIPAQPGPIMGITDPCNGSTGVSYSVTPVAGTNITYNWTVPAGAVIASGQGMSTITVDWQLSAGGLICVNAQNNCGTSMDQCLQVDPFGPPTLNGPLTGETILCADTMGVAYSVPAATGTTTGYDWVITGGTQASGGNTNQITVDWGAGPTGEVCVTAFNDCGSSSPAVCQSITINQSPPAPTAPGDDIVCAGDNNVIYTVPLVPGATSYNWTFPGSPVVSGNGTNTVSVNWGTGPSGLVCVNTENDCGTSADACFMVTINDLPVAPTGLTGAQLLCQDTNGEVYTINPVPGMITDYVWTVTGSGSIISGQGGTTATINWGNTGGDVCVYAVNDCGAGPEVCIPVTIDQILAPPSVSCGVSTTNSVSINWSHPTATNFTYTYTVNAGPVQGPFSGTDVSVLISGLNANDVVEITVIAEGGTNVCGNSSPAVQTCTANDCDLNPPMITNILPEYCIDALVTFIGSPAGGTFSGPGVAPNGDFDPFSLPAGPITVTYAYTDANNCPQSVDVITTIVLPIVPPSITCEMGTSTEVNFSWTHPTATMFEFYYTINAGTPTPTSTTSLTTLNVPGLSQGDVVELVVVALGPAPCGNSIGAAITCTPEVCPNTPPLINDINDPYCENDLSVIRFTGVPNTGTFSGAGIDPDGTFHPDVLPVGLNPITYSYTDNIGCLQMTTVDVQVIGILVPPDVICGLSSQNSVTFNWSHPDPGVTEYLFTIGINGPPTGTPILTSNQTYEVTGLSAGDIVTISIAAVGINACGNSATIELDCVADNCQTNPPTLPIDPLYCVNDSPIQLMASDGAGTYSGSPGVSASGMWSPATAGVGPHSITYTYEDAFGCDQTVTVMTEVVDFIPAPQVVCTGSSTNSVTFEVTSSATDFEYTYSINAVPQGGTVTTTNTTIVISPLAVNDVVDISVIAIGGLPCGNSAPGMAQCQAQDCPVNPATILNLAAEYCITETGIILNADPPGGVFSVDATPIAGPFNPADFTVGVHTISYVFTEANGCTRTASEMTEIIGLPAGPVVTCIASTTNSVTFDWPDYPGATGYTYTYTVDAGPVQGPFMVGVSEAMITGLSVNQNIEISVIATGMSPCDRSLETVAQCTTDPCPVNPPTITNVAAEYCITESGIVLTATPAGGVFDVDATPIVGPFNPSDYTAGPHTIGYTFTDGDGCPQTTSVPTNIVNQPPGPGVTCQMQTTNSVTFGWPAYPGATGYTYTYTVNAGPVQGPFTITATEIEIPGLLANDVVDISIVANGLMPCSQSMPATAQCVARDCGVVLAIDPVMDFCLDGTSTPVTLNVVITNTNNTGTGSWSGPCLTGPNNDIFDATLCAMAGIQNITYSYTEDGCDYSDVVQINVFAPPIAEAGNMIELDCQDPMKPLDGTGSSLGSTYLWTGPGVVSGGTTLTPQVDMIGMYTLTVTSPQGCTATDQVMVTQNGDLPVVTPLPADPITCKVGSISTLSVNSVPNINVEYTWTGPGITVGMNDKDVSPQVTEPGTYTVEVENLSTGCVSLPVTIMVDDIREDPQVLLTNPVDTIDCKTLNLTFDICTPQPGFDNTNWTYLWSFGGTPVPNGDQCSITVETPGGVYTYVITDTISGCFTSGQVEAIDIMDFPLADAGDGGVLDCLTDVIELGGPGTQQGPNIIYEWSGPGILGDNTQLNIDVNQEGTYTILVTDTISKCDTESQAVVTRDEDNPTADGGPDQELDCDFTPVDLNGNGSAGTGSIVYQWIDQDGNDLGQNPIIQVNEPGLYALAVEDIDNGCVDTTFVQVTPNSNAPQDAIVDIQDPECFGDTDGFINIVNMVGGTPPYLYSFNGQPFTTDPFITNLPPGNYPITVEDAEGCTWTTDLAVDAPEEVGLNLGIDITIQMGEDVILDAGINLDDIEIDTITWTPFDSLDCLDDICRSIQIEDLFQTTNVTATVVDTNGCSATDIVQVRVKKDRNIYIPNGFTPDEDGNNDFATIFGGTGVERVEYFYIYDRWGEIVYQAQNFIPGDPDIGWDGKLKGVKMNPAVFVYQAEVLFIDGHVQLYTGDITLMR